MIAQVESVLREGYVLLEEFSLPFPENDERTRIPEAVLSVMRDHKHSVNISAACQAYYIFRRLHAKRERNVEAATLLGDYFFSLFLSLTLPLENTWFFEQFSKELQKNCEDSVKDNKEIDMQKYIKFAESVCRGYLSRDEHN